MEAILHLGDAKSGSKSIQEWMLQDAALLEENGFHQSATTKIGPYDSRLASYGLDDWRLENNPRQEWQIRRAADVPHHRLEIERELAAEVAAARGCSTTTSRSIPLRAVRRGRPIPRSIPTAWRAGRPCHPSPPTSQRPTGSSSAAIRASGT